VGKASEVKCNSAATVDTCQREDTELLSTGWKGNSTENGHKA